MSVNNGCLGYQVALTAALTPSMNLIPDTVISFFKSYQQFVFVLDTSYVHVATTVALVLQQRLFEKI